ncbi:MAG: hypothetical protein JWN78_3226 [Bacteroidota bacterium]|nr:hypothetical protein [Bacteroidota bacterium]
MKLRSILPVVMFLILFTGACKNHDMHDSLTEPGTSTNGFATGDTAMIKDTVVRTEQMPVVKDTANKIPR